MFTIQGARNLLFSVPFPDLAEPYRSSFVALPNGDVMTLEAFAYLPETVAHLAQSEADYLHWCETHS